MAATLYVVATPIGNLQDITLRAIDILKKVDYIAAEDTRHSFHLLSHYSINQPLLAYHEHSTEQAEQHILALLAGGKSIALISDAGTPLISDPGYPLVKKAHAMGIQVVPIPGCSALIAALSVSGLATDQFMYCGFLPAKSVNRLQRLAALANTAATLVFYEAPHRIEASLIDMCSIFGHDRRITLAREITKTFETVKQLSLGDMLEWVSNDANQQRGEIVLVVEGCQDLQQQQLDDKVMSLVKLLQDEIPPKKLAKIVAEFFDMPAKTIYDYLISLKK